MKSIVKKSLILATISGVTAVAVFGTTFALVTNKQSSNTIIGNDNLGGESTNGNITVGFKNIKKQVTFSSGDIANYYLLNNIGYLDFENKLTVSDYVNRIINPGHIIRDLYLQGVIYISSDSVSITNLKYAYDTSFDIVKINFKVNGNDFSLIVHAVNFKTNNSNSSTGSDGSTNGGNDSINGGSGGDTGSNNGGSIGGNTGDSSGSGSSSGGNGSGGSTNGGTTGDDKNDQSTATPSLSFNNNVTSKPITFTTGSDNVAGNLSTSSTGVATLDLQSKYTIDNLKVALGNGASLLKALEDSNFLSKQPSSATLIANSATYNNDSISINITISYSGKQSQASLTIKVTNLKTEAIISYSLQSTYNGPVRGEVKNNVNDGDSLVTGSTVTLTVNDSGSTSTNVSITKNGSAQTISPTNNTYTISGDGSWVITLTKENKTKMIKFDISQVKFVDSINNANISIDSIIGTLNKGSNGRVTFTLSSNTNSDQIMSSLLFDKWLDTLSPYLKGTKGLSIITFSFYPNNNREFRLQFSNYNSVSIYMSGLSDYK